MKWRLPYSKQMRGASLCCVEQILRQHKLALPLGNEAELDLTRTKNKDKIMINSGAMNSDLKNGSDINFDNIIPVELEDLSEELRLEMELALEKQRKAWLAELQKTRNGVVKKAAIPSVAPSASN